MSTNFVQNQYVGEREQRGAVWMSAHGADLIRSASVAAYPAEGSASNLYRQVVEGTVMARRNDLKMHYPMAEDSAQAIVTAANDVVVADVLQFAIGQYVELPVAVATDASRFRKVTAIDYDTNTITLDGASFSLASGDLLLVDSGRSRDESSAIVTASTAVPVLDGTKFEVGDVIEFTGDTAKTITAIAGNTLTVSGAVTLVSGAQVVSDSDGQYKITSKTVTIDEYMYTPQNVLIPFRSHGEVKEVLVIGLTATAKSALEGLIVFNQRSIA